MCRYLGLLLLAAPAVAFAQPSSPPPEPPPPPVAEPAPPPPAPAPQPGYPPPAYPQQGYPQQGYPQQGYYAQPGYYQQPQPYQPPTTAQLRNGMTGEVGLGIGWLHSSEASDDAWTDASVGLSAGIGGWVSPQLAITARLSDVRYSEGSVGISNIFLGPSAQYWVDDHIFFGGGAGLGILALDIDGDNQDSINGFALDLRAGYSFSAGSENCFNVQLELAPAFYSENGADETITNLLLQVGYQHL